MVKKIKTQKQWEKKKKKKERTAQRFTVDLHSKTLSSFNFFLISWYCTFFLLPNPILSVLFFIFSNFNLSLF